MQIGLKHSLDLDAPIGRRASFGNSGT